MKRIQLPRTLPEFMSPSGQAAISEAERVINAMTNAQIIIKDAAGKEHRAALEIVGGEAIARIQL